MCDSPYIHRTLLLLSALRTGALDAKATTMDSTCTGSIQLISAEHSDDSSMQHARLAAELAAGDRSEADRPYICHVWCFQLWLMC